MAAVANVAALVPTWSWGCGVSGSVSTWPSSRAQSWRQAVSCAALGGVARHVTWHCCSLGCTGHLLGLPGEGILPLVCRLFLQGLTDDPLQVVSGWAVCRTGLVLKRAEQGIWDLDINTY